MEGLGASAANPDIGRAHVRHATWQQGEPRRPLEGRALLQLGEHTRHRPVATIHGDHLDTRRGELPKRLRQAVNAVQVPVQHLRTGRRSLETG